MKCQYFADRKDLFKWSLLLQVTTDLGREITYIPMLTRPDGKRHGEDYRFDGQPGVKNDALVRLLRGHCEQTQQKCVRCIIPFFEQSGVKFNLYRHDRHGDNDFFEHLTRREYFASIPPEWLSSRTIFLDPDKGLEIDKTREQHVLDVEIRDLFKNMTRGSVLMVFQYYRGSGFLRKRLQDNFTQLKTAVDDYAVNCIHNGNDLAFFFVTKRDRTHSSLRSSLRAYGQGYPSTTVLGTD